MAKIIPIGEPVNDAERRAIAHLREHLPDSYSILHNFEIHRGDEVFEVDLAVIAPHALFLVDVKGTRGLIEVHGPKWYPQRRAPFSSPLLKLRGHARSLKGAMVDAHPRRAELNGLYVDAVVLLTAPDAELRDPTGRDAPSVTTLAKAAAFLRDTSRIPARFETKVLPLQPLLLKALQGVARPRAGPLRFGNWEVDERLGGTDSYTEYRAHNQFAGPGAGAVRLRLYRADPYLPAAERAAQQRRMGNAYEALSRLPAHPGILGARDFFATEGEDGYVLVMEELPGQALRTFLDRPRLALTLDQKFRVARDLLAALAHAHAQGVVHRNLTPTAILLGEDGQARLTGFDYARPKADRSQTLAREIIDDLDPAYQAPECFGEPEAACGQSDVFSAGLLLYELFAGERPFANQTEVFDAGGVFPQPPSALRGELTPAFDAWLQGLCTFDPDRRPSAAQALEALAVVTRPAATSPEADASRAPPAPAASESRAPPPVDYAKLKPGAQLTHKYVVRKRLGRPGSFGVVYQVVDTLGDVARALKLVLRDRHSTLERLKKEYRTLLRVPDHPGVVRVIDADLLPGGGPPFMVFEYVEGLDVGEMIAEGLFSPEDALSFARQVMEGLAHLHRHDVYHCDIKPRNLLWTSQGAKIIDFNVSVLTTGDGGQAGGSHRYLPPDIDTALEPSIADLADRDLYAFGVTLYEVLTGRYPWDSSTPPAGQPAPDPRERSGLEDLAPDLVKLLLKMIAPQRAERYASASAVVKDLARVTAARRPATLTLDSLTGMDHGTGAGTHTGTDPSQPGPPNTNAFVDALLTLHSQSRHSNSGTRGLDALGRHLYVETALDRELLPAVLAGELSLVLITGNAGDGKTAFLQRFEELARARGARMDERQANGARFVLDGREVWINYDGSQDDGERTSDDLLRAFFAPFAGADPAAWPRAGTRLIAINEGRLVDFLAGERERFPRLRELVQRGLSEAEPVDGVAVVNLNLRCVVAAVEMGAATGTATDSLLTRLLRRMVRPERWRPCEQCDLRERCYVLHNVRTLQDETAGPKVMERLRTLYALTHLRGRLHMTLRDLGSALSFMLVGTRNCAEIHQLYAAGRRDEIVQGYYFNRATGGDAATADRLLTLLKEVDPGQATDPRLDRGLGFVAPAEDAGLFRFAGRGHYDREILQRLFEDRPLEVTGSPGAATLRAHRAYLAMARRRRFFERRDGGWVEMLPYGAGRRLLAIIESGAIPPGLLGDLLEGINRSEGLSQPRSLRGSLALQVREVERGSIRSYRLFPAERFTLALPARAARFVEHLPDALVLRYRHADRHAGASAAELRIGLDVFEMLARLNAGYRPTVEEQQGYYLSLQVFKNLLGATPYQEVLLTATGQDFFRIRREPDGRLSMDRLREPALEQEVG